MKKTKMVYVAPRVHQVEFKIEKGFAGSTILHTLEANVDGADWSTTDNSNFHNTEDRGVYFTR